MKTLHMHQHDVPRHGSQPGKTVDPVCGMSVDPTTSELHHEHQGKIYYFCSTHCLQKFAEQPESFIDKDEQVPVGRIGKGGREFIDPVCGMRMDDPDAYQPYIHKGKTYYFCSGHCLTKFKANPESYLGDQKHPQHSPAKTPPVEFRDPTRFAGW